MSDEALQHFLHRSHGGFYLGAKAGLMPQNKDGQKYPKRDPDAKDAVALLPLIYGVFKLNKKSILPIQRPLLGLQLPRTTARGTWDLRVNKAMAIVIAHMKELKMSFYDTTVKRGNKVPFAEVLLEINKIDTALADALAAIKLQTVQNAVDVRFEILKTVAEQVKSSADLGIKLSSKLQTEWNKSLADIQRLPLNYKVAFDPRDDFSGTTGADATAFWTDGIQTQCADDKIYKAKATVQETYQLDVIIASIRLHVLYYKQLAATINGSANFPRTIMAQIHMKLRNLKNGPEIEALVLGSDEENDWKDKAGLFFRNVLIERFELLQANLYTFFTAYAGRGKVAEEHTQTVITMAVRSAVSPLFESTEQLQINSTDTDAEKANKLAHIASREKGTSFGVYIPKIVRFFEDSQVAGAIAINQKDKEHIKTCVNALFTSLPISIKKVEMNDLTIPSRAKALDDNAGTKFHKLPALTGKDAPKVSVSLEFTEKKGAQHFREALGNLFNRPDLAFDVTSRILHAAGLLDSAFVAAYYNTEANSKVEYKALVPQLLASTQGAQVIAEGTVLISRPAWVTALLTPTTAQTALTVTAVAIPGLDTLFTFKNNCGSTLTQPPKRAENKKKAPQKKPDGAKKKGGSTKAPDNAKKPDKKKPDDKNKKKKKGKDSKPNRGN